MINITNYFRFGNYTKFSFRFSEKSFQALHRTRTHTVIDFLSYVGGVLGLFAGISVLSFFEVFYFFSFRILSNFCILRNASNHSVLIVRPAK